MQRRRFLVGTAGVLVATAGCTGGDDGQSSQSGPEKRYESLEELPTPDALLEAHTEVLHQLQFVAEETSEQTSSESSEPETRTRTIKKGEAGTLITGDDVVRRHSSQDQQQAWIVDHARITRFTHSYHPDEELKPYIESSTVTDIVELGVFERVDVIEDGQVFVFEATEVDTENNDFDDVTIEAFDVHIEITKTGYVRSIDAEVTIAAQSDPDRTQTFRYGYQVSNVGDVSVSKPAFVEDALRIEAELAEDRSVLRLKHAGGPTVSAGTAITMQDRTAIAHRDLTVPMDFESGDEAYAYWESETEGAIAVEEEPSEVARKWTRPTEDTERNIYLEGMPEQSSQRFEVRFTQKA